MEWFLELLGEEWFRTTLFTGGGGLVGFLSRPFIMSKKERIEADQIGYSNARDLMRENNTNFKTFLSALDDYIAKTDSGKLVTSDFAALASVADKYFTELNLAASAVLDGRLSKHMRENSFMPLFLDAVQKSLPAYYRVMERSSKSLKLSWGGKLRRENYAGIYDVVEKFRPKEPIPKLF